MPWAETLTTPMLMARRLGCQLAQGYHFARPVPAGEISELLAGTGGAYAPAPDRSVSPA